MGISAFVFNPISKTHSAMNSEVISGRDTYLEGEALISVHDRATISIFHV